MFRLLARWNMSHGSPATIHTAGVGVRSGVDLVGNASSRTVVDEGSADGSTLTVGHLSRHNSRVAAAKNCGELARCDLS